LRISGTATNRMRSSLIHLGEVYAEKRDWR
jgi:hypothetical protein